MRNAKNHNIDNYNKSFPTTLRKLIERKGCTIKSVAEAAGVSRQAASQYQDGTTQPNAETIVKIAEYFDVTIDYLLTGQKAEADDSLQMICDYTGLNENSVNFLLKLNSYKIGNSIVYPVGNGIRGQVTCEYDMPMYIVNLLLSNEQIMGIMQCYLCMLNDENTSVYQGDKWNSILFELMLELRKLRDEFQSKYKEAFYNYYNNERHDSGNDK